MGHVFVDGWCEVCDIREEVWSKYLKWMTCEDVIADHERELEYEGYAS